MSEAGAPLSAASKEARISLHPSPTLYPLSIDAGRVRLLKLSEADYTAASFLDDRLLATTPPIALCSWDELEASARNVCEDCHFIFHIGHVGSTLVSRLLGEHPQLFSVREPALLRDLASRYLECGLAGNVEDHSLGHETELLMRLWSRVWQPQQTAVIKATSLVSGMAYALLERAPATTRAISMVVTPLVYLRSIIGQPHSLTELQAMAPQRARRLTSRLKRAGVTMDTLSIGEMIAMSWLCEVLALCDAARAKSAAVLWLDFDVFLGDPAAALLRMYRHLGVSTDEGLVSAALGAPAMRQYSKDPSHAFTMEQRRQIMREAQLDHGGEINKGMAWLGQLANAIPTVREAVQTIAANSRAPSAPA